MFRARNYRETLVQHASRIMSRELGSSGIISRFGTNRSEQNVRFLLASLTNCPVTFCNSFFSNSFG